jgi:hypothetical protein
VVFRAALGKRLGHVFRNQIKQVVTVNIVFPGGVASLTWALTCSMAWRSAAGSQLQMVDIANDHTYLKDKTAFHF